MSLIGLVIRDALSIRHPLRSPDEHLDAAIEWLCRAQDATGSGGVARSYALRYMRGHQRRGWLAAYPETTGYIIPTFLAYAAIVGRNDLRERALRMSRWEVDVQMESGAVQGGERQRELGSDIQHRPGPLRLGRRLS